MSLATPVLYTVFAAIVAVLLAIDLFVVQRESHTVSIKEAGIWSAIWVGVSVVFGLAMPFFYDGGSGSVMIEYFTGYLIEKSLSVDNVFLFVLIFQAFAVPDQYQHRVLFYGVLGAIVMRVILIFAGVALINRFEWLLYVFGAFLLYIAWKTWFHRHEQEGIEDSRMMRAVRRVIPATRQYRHWHFMVHEGGKWLATPLLIVLVMVELSDLVFAMDSIPAIFAITRDPFIIITSNIFAILGLRALYFLVAGLADKLYYLKSGLAVILGVVGLKLITENIHGIWHPGPLSSLGIIAAILVVVIAMSLLRNPPPSET